MRHWAKDETARGRSTAGNDNFTHIVGLYGRKTFLMFGLALALGYLRFCFARKDGISVFIFLARRSSDNVVHHISQRRQRTTEPGLQSTCTENLVTFGHVGIGL